MEGLDEATKSSPWSASTSPRSRKSTSADRRGDPLQEDLDADSLDLYELVMELETYGVTVPRSRRPGSRPSATRSASCSSTPPPEHVAPHRVRGRGAPALIDELPTSCAPGPHPLSWTERRVDSSSASPSSATACSGSRSRRLYELRGRRLRRPHQDPQPGGRASPAPRWAPARVPEMLRAEPEDHGGDPGRDPARRRRPLPEATEALIGPALAFGFERTADAWRRLRACGSSSPPRPGSTSSPPCRSFWRGAGRVSYEVRATVPHRRTFEVAAIVDSERVGRGGRRRMPAAARGDRAVAFELAPAVDIERGGRVRFDREP
jgi:hypothetical protein